MLWRKIRGVLCFDVYKGTCVFVRASETSRTIDWITQHDSLARGARFFKRQSLILFTPGSSWLTQLNEQHDRLDQETRESFWGEFMAVEGRRNKASIPMKTRLLKSNLKSNTSSHSKGWEGQVCNESLPARMLKPEMKRHAWKTIWNASSENSRAQSEESSTGYNPASGLNLSFHAGSTASRHWRSSTNKCRVINQFNTAEHVSGNLVFVRSVSDLQSDDFETKLVSCSRSFLRMYCADSLAGTEMDSYVGHISQLEILRHANLMTEFVEYESQYRFRT